MTSINLPVGKALITLQSPSKDTFISNVASEKWPLHSLSSRWLLLIFTLLLHIWLHILSGLPANKVEIRARNGYLITRYISFCHQKGSCKIWVSCRSLKFGRPLFVYKTQSHVSQPTISDWYALISAAKLTMSRIDFLNRKVLSIFALYGTKPSCFVIFLHILT